MEVVEKYRSLKERKEGKGRKEKGRKQREFPKVGLCFLHQFLEYFWGKAQGGAKLG